MIVIRDDGVGRHVRFKEPGTSNQYFDLITWPGHLCYTGDMGTYVFERTADMFEFFRKPRRADGSLSINLGYWTEKLIAVDGNRGGGKVKQFDEAKFKRVINDYRIGWMRSAKESGALDKAGRRELWEAVDDEVLRMLEDGGDRAQYAAYDFCHDPRSNPKRPYGWTFTDLFENDMTEYTHSIVWCCYALAWGIEKYDAAKQPAAEAVPA
nr:hypothetical protein [Duganella violaceicalia]